MSTSTPPGDSGVSPELSIVAFAQTLGLEHESIGFLYEVPSQILAAIIANFDPSGTKDGNVLGRLQGYTKFLLKRNGLEPPLALDGGQSRQDWRSKARLPSLPSRALPAANTGNALMVENGAGVSGLAEFVNTLRLDVGASNFLQSLPPEVQRTVINTFDASSSKDGYVWGRLFAFARRVWAQHAGIDRGTLEQVKLLPEGEQMRIILDWVDQQKHSVPVAQYAHQLRPVGQAAHYQLPVARATAAANPSPLLAALAQPFSLLLQALAPIASAAAPVLHAPSQLDAAAASAAAVSEFARLWGLDERASNFLQGLRSDVRDHVLRSFDGSGTKDGNVWGRLLAFIRQTWAKSLGLEPSMIRFMKDMPDDAQIICVRDFDPSGTKDGNVLGRLQSFARKAMRQAELLGGPGVLNTPTASSVVSHAMFPQQSGVGTGIGGDPADLALLGFMERCGLDASVLPWLQSLAEDIRDTMILEFDPSGTKDGNVLGRLQGYVRLLNARAQRKRTSGDPSAFEPQKRLRQEGFG